MTQDLGVPFGPGSTSLRSPEPLRVSSLDGVTIPDAELLEVASEFRDGILQGRSSFMMCAAVSWPLATYLRSLHGVDCETVESDIGECNHFWIKLADGRALDPTLDQFNRWFPWKNYPPVYLGPVEDYERILGIDAQGGVTRTGGDGEAGSVAEGDSTRSSEGGCAHD